MKVDFFKSIDAAANQGGAMEADTINSRLLGVAEVKHGASLNLNNFIKDEYVKKILE